MPNLERIFTRIRKENLHGPTSPITATGGWEEIIKENFDDLDAVDPRWFDMFHEFFIRNPDEDQDDLLFFVRQNTRETVQQKLASITLENNIPTKSAHNISQSSMITSPESSTNKQSQSSSSKPKHILESSDPIFVRRKEGQKLPALDDIICWKQTFFLNLVVQLPCVLSVSVCERKTSTTTTNTNESSTKRLEAINRSARTVYASPYESFITPSANKKASKRLFSKRKRKTGAHTLSENEISYPLIYYSVIDFTDFSIPIRPNQYLCVELAILQPHHPKMNEYVEEQKSQSTEPFIAPPSTKKIILFQGAVQYSALEKVYLAKASSADDEDSDDEEGANSKKQNDLTSSAKGVLKGFMSKLANMTNSFTSSTSQNSLDEARDSSQPSSSATSVYSSAASSTVSLPDIIPSEVAGDGNGNANAEHERPLPKPPKKPKYTPQQTILMRGPNGKGQCQVGVSKKIVPPVVDNNEGRSLSNHLDDELVCHLRYINVPWQSVAYDLFKEDTFH